MDPRIYRYSAPPATEENITIYDWYIGQAFLDIEKAPPTVLSVEPSLLWREEFHRLGVLMVPGECSLKGDDEWRIIWRGWSGEDSTEDNR